MIYELYYWPGIQGRGEYVRLALEEAGAKYIDVAMSEETGGVPAMLKILEDEKLARPPFAPPFLRAGRVVVAQTANILLFLGKRLGLAPRDEAARLWTHQLQLTLADFVLEAFSTHHPLGDAYAYEEQKGPAKRRTKDFLETRLPKFLGYFERVLERNPGGEPWMVGSRLTYVDLSMAQVIDALRYGFPRASRRELRARPRLRALHERVLARPRIRRYMASDRRQAYNNEDLIRRYPELDS